MNFLHLTQRKQQKKQALQAAQYLIAKKTMLISIWEIVFAWPTAQKTFKSSNLEWNTWNVCITPTCDSARTTHSTVYSPGYTSYTKTTLNMADTPVPDPVITNTEDGMVRISVGDEKGWVSSHHLVQPKLNQLIQTWLLKHNKS